MDPYDYDIDPVSPGLLKQKGGFPAFTEPSKVSSLSGGGGMDPIIGSALISGGLKALGGLFGMGRQRREEDLQRREREQAMRLARQQFGLQKQQYGDTRAQQRALAEIAKQKRGQIASGEVFNRRAPTKTYNYRNVFEDGGGS